MTFARRKRRVDGSLAKSLLARLRVRDPLLHKFNLKLTVKLNSYSNLGIFFFFFFYRFAMSCSVFIQTQMQCSYRVFSDYQNSHVLNSFFQLMKQ